MPVFDYKCSECGVVTESFTPFKYCSCGATVNKLPPLVSIVIPGNIGPKLRTRATLDDELKRQGFQAPLFKSELQKDQVKWASKKLGV